MAGDNFAAGFSIDISSLKAGLAAANKLIRESEAQFKAAAAGMDDWRNSQEGLEKRVDSLNKIVDIQAEKVNALQREKERIIATMEAEGASNEEIARAVDKVNGQIIKESNALERNRAELDKAQQALEAYSAAQADAADSASDNRTASERLTDTIEGQQSELERLKKQFSDVALEQGVNSAEAKSLARQIRELSGDLEENQGKLADVEKHANAAAGELDDLDKSADNVGEGFTVAKGAIAGFVANGLTALVDGVKNSITNLLNLAEETRETRTAFAKVEQSFMTATENIEIASENTIDAMYGLTGVLGDADRAAESSSFLAKYSKDGQDLQKNIRVLTGVFAEYGDSIPTEGLAEGIAATSEMGEVQGVLADALEWQGVNLDDYNTKLGELKTSEERAAYIQETLSEIYGKSADAYRENNAAIIEANEAQLRYSDYIADVGEKVEPITTAIKNGFSDILGKVLELTDGIDTAQISETISGGFQTFIDDVIPKIIDGFQWITDNKDTIISAVAGIGAGFAVFKVASLINGVVGAIKAFKLANEGATVAQWLMNAAMNANPIGILVTVIGAVVAAVITFIATNEDARAKIAEVWEKIKSGFVSFGDKVKEIFEKVKQFFMDLAVKASEMWTKLKQGAVDAWQGVKNTFSKVATFFGDIFSKAWQKVKDVFSAGGAVFANIKEGIESVFKSVVNSIIRGINKVVSIPFNAINGALDRLRDLSIAGVSPFTWLPTVAVPKIPELAMGGIVNKATHAVVGEAGAEAVLPLERNTGWMDMLAEKLASKMPAAAPTVNQHNYFSQAHSRYELYKTKQQTQAALRLALKGG